MENEVMFTAEEILKWPASELKTRMADPRQRPAIDEALRKRAEEAAANLNAQNADLDARESARLQRRNEIEQERLKLQQDREAETLRLSRMTPEERKNEYEKQVAEAAENERQAEAVKVAAEREAARQATLTPAEKKAEQEAAAEAERLAAEQAEQEAQAAAQKEAEDKAAADKVAADAAEAEKVALEEKQRIASEEAAKPKQKIVKEYQIRDDAGNPIGRPTHLEADSWEEMSEKQEAAHANAMRLAERLRKRAELKPTPKAPEKPISILTDAERTAAQKELESQDATTASLAKLKLEQDEIQKERAMMREQTRLAEESRQAYLFMQKNQEFNPCEANAKILYGYIEENGLEFNANNLEVAYAATESQLAPRQSVAAPPAPTPVVTDIKRESAPANPAPTPAPVAASAPAPVAVAPASTPVEATPAAANPPVAARKLPAGGIEPGTLHGGRQTGIPKPTGLTKQDVAKMPLAEYKKRLKDPNFKKQLNAIGIKA